MKVQRESLLTSCVKCGKDGAVLPFAVSLLPCRKMPDAPVPGVNASRAFVRLTVTSPVTITWCLQLIQTEERFWQPLNYGGDGSCFCSFRPIEK